MKKKTKIGWIHKDSSPEKALEFINKGQENERMHFNFVYTKKGTKRGWDESWPPVKVKVTIEVME